MIMMSLRWEVIKTRCIRQLRMQGAGEGRQESVQVMSGYPHPTWSPPGTDHFSSLASLTTPVKQMEGQSFCDDIPKRYSISISTISNIQVNMTKLIFTSTIISMMKNHKSTKPFTIWEKPPSPSVDGTMPLTCRLYFSQDVRWKFLFRWIFSIRSKVSLANWTYHSSEWQ